MKFHDSLALMPESAKIAYEGEHTSPSGRKARSFVYSVEHDGKIGQPQAYLYRFRDEFHEAKVRMYCHSY